MKFFSVPFLNLGLVFYPSKLFVPTEGSMPGGNITPARWVAVHMGSDKSFCHFEEITNSSAPTGDNIIL